MDKFVINNVESEHVTETRRGILYTMPQELIELYDEVYKTKQEKEIQLIGKVRN